MILGNRDKPTSIGEARAMNFNKKFDFDADDNLLEKGLKGLGRYTFGAGVDAGALLTDIFKGNIMGDRRYQREFGMDDVGDALAFIPGGAGIKAGIKGAKHIAPLLTKAGRQGMKPGAVGRSLGKAGKGLATTRKRDIAGAAIGVPALGAAFSADDMPIAEVLGMDGAGGEGASMPGVEQTTPTLDNSAPINPETGRREYRALRSDFDPLARDKPMWEKQQELMAYAQQLPEGSEKRRAMEQIGKLVRGKSAMQEEDKLMMDYNQSYGQEYNAYARDDLPAWEDLDYSQRKSYIQARKSGNLKLPEGTPPPAKPTTPASPATPATPATPASPATPANPADPNSSPATPQVNPFDTYGVKNFDPNNPFHVAQAQGKTKPKTPFDTHGVKNFDPNNPFDIAQAQGLIKNPQRMKERDSRYQLPAYSQGKEPVDVDTGRDSRYQLPAYSQEPSFDVDTGRDSRYQLPVYSQNDPVRDIDRDSRYQLPAYSQEKTSNRQTASEARAELNAKAQANAERKRLEEEEKRNRIDPNLRNIQF
tara:strand:- start:2308 stop:3912 length:1605 start_codon:yes stop_codon:yes gene_type:complete